MQVPGFVAKPAKRAGSATARLTKRAVLGVALAAVATFVMIVLDALLLGDERSGGERP